MYAEGIDVSKGKSTVTILQQSGIVSAKPYDVSHTKKDLDQLVKRIKKLPEGTNVVMEATGIYYEPIARYLHDQVSLFPLSILCSSTTSTKTVTLTCTDESCPN